MKLIRPDWPAAARVQAFTSCRSGGFSDTPFSSLNLSLQVQDDSTCVARNRHYLKEYTGMPNFPRWFRQVHGSQIVEAGAPPQNADGSYSDQSGQVCAVLSADCLPILLCDHQATRVAAIHAGWRGLAANIVAKAVGIMRTEPAQLMAWMGPAISQQAFEVGAEVYNIFVRAQAEYEAAFNARDNKYQADIYAIAKLQLKLAGVSEIYGGGLCTFSQSEDFFSYRRDKDTGRMGSFIWLD